MNRQRLLNLQHLIVKAISNNILRFKGFKVGNRIPVLCYHRIWPESIDGKPTAHDTYTVTTEQFASQIAFLAQNGFKSLTLAEYADVARGRKAAEERSVLLTFDDGYVDNYLVAWPIAQSYKMSINLFVLTEFIDERDPILIYCSGKKLAEHAAKFTDLWRQLTWAELRTMQSSGVHIALHGHSHRYLSTMDANDITNELTAARKICRDQLGKAPVFYAIPFGNYNSFRSQDISLLKSLGFELIFSTISGRTPLPTRQSPISRIVIQKDDDLQTFKNKLFGAYDWIGTVQGWQQLVYNSLKFR